MTRAAAPLSPGPVRALAWGMSEKPTSVAEEIGQRVPFRGPGQEAVIALLRSADELRRYLSERLAVEGLTPQQYNVLRILRGAGSAGLPTLTIGDRMIERQPGVTRLIDRLVKKGLVERRRGSEDRRKVLCTLSDRGSVLLDRLDPVVEKADDVLERALPRERLRTLVSILDDVREVLRRDDEGAPGV